MLGDSVPLFGHMSPNELFKNTRDPILDLNSNTKI